MTTLIAIQHEGWCLIAADSLATDHSRKYDISPTGKVAINNGYLFASAGLCRGQNILAYGWNPPRPPRGVDLDKFMTRTFIPSMRKAFITAGYDMKSDSDIATFDNDLLIAVKGVIYSIDCSYSWERCSGRAYAAGSGGSYALGALDAYGIDEVATAEEAITMAQAAVKVAEKRDPYSGGDVQVAFQYANGKSYSAILDD
jgi:ATP-dependent protease HslVU (ClpYQ) peptidase subunit